MRIHPRYYKNYSNTIEIPSIIPEHYVFGSLLDFWVVDCFEVDDEQLLKALMEYEYVEYNELLNGPIPKENTVPRKLLDELFAENYVNGDLKDSSQYTDADWINYLARKKAYGNLKDLTKLQKIKPYLGYFDFITANSDSRIITPKEVSRALEMRRLIFTTGPFKIMIDDLDVNIFPKTILEHTTPGGTKCKAELDFLLTSVSKGSCKVLDFKTTYEYESNFKTQFWKNEYAFQSAFYSWILVSILDVKGKSITTREVKEEEYLVIGTYSNIDSPEFLVASKKHGTNGYKCAPTLFSVSDKVNRELIGYDPMRERLASRGYKSVIESIEDLEYHNALGSFDEPAEVLRSGKITIHN